MARESVSKRRTRLFVNILIGICLFVCAVITGVTLYEYHRLDMVLDAVAIAALLAVWGGELLLIVVRQVLGSDYRKKKHNDENGGSVG